MEVVFRDPDLDRLETDPRFTSRLPPPVVRQYRKALQHLRAAIDERDIRAVRGYRLERLRGDRAGQYSIRLNDQFRLIIELEGIGPEKTVVIVAVEDYH